MFGWLVFRLNCELLYKEEEMGMEEFGGKVVVIIGGVSGIGLVMVKVLVREGVKFVLVDIEVFVFDKVVVDFLFEGVDVIGV